MYYSFSGYVMNISFSSEGGYVMDMNIILIQHVRLDTSIIRIFIFIPKHESDIHFLLLKKQN